MNYRDNNKKPIIIAFLLSLLFIHLPLFYFLFTSNFLNEQIATFKSKPEAIFINLQNQSLPQRIVDIAKPKVQEVPDKPSAQGQYNVKTKEETTAASTLNKQSSAATKPTPKVQTAQTQTAQTTPKNQEIKKQEPVSQTQPVEKETPPKQNLSLKDELKNLRDESKAVEQEKYQKTFGAMKALNLPPQQLRTSLSGGNSDDFLPDYKIGDRTYVNTLANPNIFYFVELRRKFRMAFNPIPSLRANIGQIMNKSSVSVVVGVSVDANGNLKDLVLIKDSGIAGYNDEAKRTVKVSSPFTNPPANFLDKNGNLNMAWTFVVYF